MDKKFIMLFAIYILSNVLLFSGSSLSFFSVLLLLSVIIFYYLFIEKDLKRNRVKKEAFYFIKNYIYIRFILKKDNYLKICLKHISKELQKDIVELNGEKEILDYLNGKFNEPIFNKFIQLLEDNKNKNLSWNYYYQHLDSQLSKYSLKRNYRSFESYLINILIYNLIIIAFHYLSVRTLNVNAKQRIDIAYAVFYIVQWFSVLGAYHVIFHSEKKEKDYFIDYYLMNLLFYSPSQSLRLAKTIFSNEDEVMNIFISQDHEKLIEYYNNEKNKIKKEVLLFSFYTSSLKVLKTDDYKKILDYLNELHLNKQNLATKYFNLGQLILFGILFIFQYYMVINYGI